MAAGLTLTAGAGLLGTFPAQAEDTPASLTTDQWSQVDAYSRANDALGVAPGASGALVRLPADRIEPVIEKDAPPSTTVKASRFTKGDITSIDGAVREALRPDHSTEYGLMSQYDVATDRVVVTTDAPSTLSEPLVREYGDKIKIESGKFAAQRGRYRDTVPFYGGLSLTREGSGRCSGGVSVMRADTAYMTTAAHCYPINPNVGVYNYTTDWEEVGKVTNRYNGIDQELLHRDVTPIRGAYFGRIWSGQSPNALDYLNIEGQLPAFLGLDNICVTGQTTYAHCGNKVTDMSPGSICWPDTQICVEGGGSFLYRPDPCANCTVKFTEGGDSGAPIYKWTRNETAKIVGLHTGVVWRSGVQYMVGVRIGPALDKMGATLNTAP
ncbi:hypothetical protein [Streptomyces graminofaciens]|nr:hypothetical protein [Streptomyces graminofaciens]